MKTDIARIANCMLDIHNSPAVSTLPMVPCGSSPVTCFAPLPNEAPEEEAVFMSLGKRAAGICTAGEDKTWTRGPWTPCHGPGPHMDSFFKIVINEQKQK